MIDPSFQEINRLFVLSLGTRTDRDVHTGYFFPKVEIKEYNFIIDERNFFDQPIKNNKITYDKISKIATGQGDDYTTGCLLDQHYKLIAIGLSKQQKLDADTKAIQQINFTGNLERDGNRQMFFIIEEAKETILDFSKELFFYFVLI